MANKRKHRDDLKPCPFCGAKAQVTFAGTYVQIACRSKRYSRYELEIGCGATLSTFTTENDAIRRWNARAGTASD